MYVITRSYPFLRVLIDLFYESSPNKISDFIIGGHVKVISYSIMPYLDPIALSVWAMDDGSPSTSWSGLYLHTKSFTIPDVYRLAGMMHYQYGLTVNVQIHKNMPVIYIPSNQIAGFLKMVRPHFHSSMTYKLSGFKQQ